MTEEQFTALIGPVLKGLGAVHEYGEEFLDPPLDVLRYDHRIARLGRLPVLGRGLGVVMLAREPRDVDGTAAGQARLLERMARAANGRFPPWKGLVIGLTALVLTDAPIQPGDEELLRQALDVKLKRLRVVPFGLVRLNLEQEALAMAANASEPAGLFPEPVQLVDALHDHFRRFVPLLET